MFSGVLAWAEIISQRINVDLFRVLAGDPNSQEQGSPVSKQDQNKHDEMKARQNQMEKRDLNESAWRDLP